MGKEQQQICSKKPCPISERVVMFQREVLIQYFEQIQA